MKRIINSIFFSLLVIFGLFTVCISCNEDMETYDNKAFVSSPKVETILLTGKEIEKAVIQTELPKLEAKEVRVTYVAAPLFIDEYNQIYGEEAIVVPENHYEILENTSIIPAGSKRGNDVEVLFKDLSTLNRDLVYVLPVTVSESTIDFLNSTRTSYFVIKNGALINTVANITRNYLALQAPATSTLKEMQQLTVETLIRVDKFGKLISTVMGIEGSFLLRIGDAGLPDNQLQVAIPNGNVTDAAWQLPTNEWIHLAATYNSKDGAVEVFLNGIKKGATQYTNYRASVNWAKENFHIGKSYDDNRWLEGHICETRVWNRILTIDEVNSKNHFYSVPTNSEGLAAYWKFNEGSGKTVEDHTGNGNTMVANDDLTWLTVSLPNK